VGRLPANANPRPLILFDDTVEFIPQAGFLNDDRKIAWTCNRLVLAGGLSLAAQGMPGEIGAATAYGELMASRAARAGPTTSQCASEAPFVITEVRHSRAGFMTDRGTQLLPAWLFDVPEVGAYIGQTALPSGSWWGGRLATEGAGALVSDDGRTLRIGVSNPGSQPCQATYTTAVAESATAVAVAVKGYPNPVPAGEGCDLVARVGYVSVTLAAPLGGRVVVDQDGNAGAACRETPTPGAGTATC